MNGLSQMKKILLVCVENAGRSQMAEAFAKAYGDARIEATSAGTLPAKEVNTVAVQVMREKGIDLPILVMSLGQFLRFVVRVIRQVRVNLVKLKHCLFQFH